MLAYMRTANLAALPLLLACATAEAQIAPKDTSYSCAVEFAAGLRYNGRTKKWEGAKFKPEAKFVLRMKYLRSMAGKEHSGKDEPAQLFDVTTTKAGSSTALPCENPLEPSGSVAIGGDEVEFDCLGANLQEFKFNLKTNRFLAIYAIGYVDGTNNNADNPTLSGGTCTKID